MNYTISINSLTVAEVTEKIDVPIVNDYKKTENFLMRLDICFKKSKPPELAKFKK